MPLPAPGNAERSASEVRVDLNAMKAENQMRAILGTETTIYIGKKRIIDSISPNSTLAVVVEDDGQSAYFYGLPTAQEGNSILDALQIYNVQQVLDTHHLAKLTIIWSADGLKPALLINDYPHAVVDFEAQRAYCRTNFPPADKRWANNRHEWDDSAIEWFI